MIYIIKGREFESYKELKTWAYFNMKTGEKVIAYEIERDIIHKEYEIYKQERRLIAKKTYDMWEEHLRQIEELQLKLF